MTTFNSSPCEKSPLEGALSFLKKKTTTNWKCVGVTLMRSTTGSLELLASKGWLMQRYFFFLVHLLFSPALITTADWSKGFLLFEWRYYTERSSSWQAAFLKMLFTWPFLCDYRLFWYRASSKLACRLSSYLSEGDRRKVGPVSVMFCVTVWRMKMLSPEFPFHLCWYPQASLDDVFSYHSHNALCIDYVIAWVQ